MGKKVKLFIEDVPGDKFVLCRSPKCKYFDKSVCTLTNNYVVVSINAICNSFEECKDQKIEKDIQYAKHKRLW